MSIIRFCFTEEQDKLKKEINEYFASELRGDLLEWVEKKLESQISVESSEFTEKLAQKGWLSLQETHGMQEGAIFEELSGYWRAPVAYHNERLVGWLIKKFGTDHQKEYFLPKLINGQITIALGFSEPGCGSDLASLKTKAVADGDEYVVSGQKIYSSNAPRTTHTIAAVRSNPDVPKHKGISLILVDLKSPGVTVRPIPMLRGNDSAEVFLEDVRVPKENLIGERDRGWYYLAATLEHHRIRIHEVGMQRRLIEELIQYVKETDCNGEPLSNDPFIRDMIAERAIEAEVGRLLNYRSVWASSKGIAQPHYFSMANTQVKETSQRIAQTAMEILGPLGCLQPGAKGAPIRGRMEGFYRWAPAMTIGTGTSEINRNIIAERGLNLPKE